jgi:hypothetical protein
VVSDTTSASQLSILTTTTRDQELRFSVHDSPDYHNLKVSVFNDDKKTELIGETWVSLESVVLPGGGQSDGWHALNCKGKYAGDVRIELTYYDTRPKAEKPVVEHRESARAERGSPAVGGPRESTPVKRRPLPSDPTGASPSPSVTPDHRGPRGYPTPPLQQRPSERTLTGQRPSPSQLPDRRALPDAAPLNGTPQPRTSPMPPAPSVSAPQYTEANHHVSYAAPKPYAVQPVDAIPHHVRDQGHRTASQDDFRSSHGHGHAELLHSYSAPVVPTQHGDGSSHGQASQQLDNYAYHDQSYQVAPLRMSRNHDRSQSQSMSQDLYQAPSYEELHMGHENFSSHGRLISAMQPTVEDEDDPPPPPPVHRSNAYTLPQDHQQSWDYHDHPAPLNISRYREEPSHAGYDSPPQAYNANDYSAPASAERRHTYPRPVSRPVSRDTMAPSPLRNETSLIPASLIPGIDTSRQERRDSVAYQAMPAYDSPSRGRQHSEHSEHSELDDFSSSQYDEAPGPYALVHHRSFPLAEANNYYPHPAPQEPRHTSPIHDPAPIVKPQAVSPGYAHTPVDRSARTPTRSMPTRKSVSPRPPPSAGHDSERRLSAVPFNPDSFDVYNPTVSKKASNAAMGEHGDDRRDGNVEFNDKGQIVTFSGRVIDASDHLPIDSWAPEPERKGEQKTRPVRERPVLSGARDLEAAKQRERDYRRERQDRDGIRSAVDTIHADSNIPSNALVLTSRHRYSSNGSPMQVNPGAMVLANPDSTSPGPSRLQQRNPRPVSAYGSPSNIPMPSTHVLRERENVGGYGGSPGYSAGSRHSVAAPPIPAKIPMDGGFSSGDLSALSLELQSIDIGPGSGGRSRGTARRRYDAC